MEFGRKENHGIGSDSLIAYLTTQREVKEEEANEPKWDEHTLACSHIMAHFIGHNNDLREFSYL